MGFRHFLKNWPVGSAEHTTVHNSDKRNKSNNTLKAVAGALALTFLVPGGCSVYTETQVPPEDATILLEERGYSNITQTDTDLIFTGCGRDGLVAYDFEATNAQPTDDSAAVVQSIKVCVNGLLNPTMSLRFPNE